MKYTGPKAKRVRRQGVNIYGSDKYDKILQKKPYGPGKSPRDRQPRKTEYALQLIEKQKMRDMYGLSEKQFKRLYDEASSSQEQTGDMIKRFIEMRLDNLIYRSGFAMTRLQSRQFVSHGHFLVNGQRVTIPSYRVRPGDVITVRDKSKSSPVFGPILSAHEKYMPPAWLKVNANTMSVEVIAVPEPDMAEAAVDMRQVIEYYSRR